MITLNWPTINSTLQDKSNKNIEAHMNKNLLQEWSKCSTNYFNYCFSKCSSYEVAQIISAHDNYLKKKNKANNFTRYRKKQLLMVELGENYNNLSYKHPAIVIDSINDKVFVVPCTSGHAPKNKDGQIHKGYIEANELDGFSHLTTVILKEARCIDKMQVLYAIKEDTKYKMVTPEFFKKLNDELFKLLFEVQAYKLNKQVEIIENLNNEVEVLNQEILDKSQEIMDKSEEIRLLKEELEKIKLAAVDIQE